MEALSARKSNSLILKTYSQSNIKQLGMCTVRLRHTNKIARYGFFVVQADSLVLLGMFDMEMLGILKIMCKVVGGQQVDRKFNSQTVQPSNGYSCKANIGQQIKTDTGCVINANSNLQDYFKCCISRAADKRASQVLIQKNTK